jgi:mannose-6-phosphate isomerase-like protein (cupin superfamily)/DNA-binding XRE family transcriptional regulator
MQIGDKLRSLRLQRHLTLAELSQAAGVSKSMLSRIERDDSAPTVTTLDKIATALGTDLGRLFGDEDGASAPARGQGFPVSAVERSSLADTMANGNGPAAVAVVRAGQRKKVIMPWGADYEMLAPDMRRRIEFIAITYPVDGGSGELYSHEGEECGVVVEGRFRGIVGGEEFVLEPGDSIYYASSTPHRWENAGDVEAKAVWAITPPSFLTGKIIE